MSRDGGNRDVHVPRLQVNEGTEEVKTVGSSDGDDELTEDLIGLNELYNVLPAVQRVRDVQVNCERCMRVRDRI
jgi:hypothetical protein